MCKVYGYCRVSTAKQSIERQQRNIAAAYPHADIRSEAYTGTKFDGRKEFEKLLKVVKPRDIIVFDSVSRMSRNAEEGYEQYMQLFNNGVELVFLKEPTINTQTYKAAKDSKLGEMVSSGDADADELINTIREAVERYMLKLAERQIKLAFDQAQKEVDDLHVRTKEGIRAKKDAGVLVGGAAQKSSTRTSKKEAPAKKIIKAHYKLFGGELNKTEVAKLAGITRVTADRYIEELLEQENN